MKKSYIQKGFHGSGLISNHGEGLPSGVLWSCDICNMTIITPTPRKTGPIPELEEHNKQYHPMKKSFKETWKSINKEKTDNRCWAQVGDDWCQEEVEDGETYCDEHKYLEKSFKEVWKGMTEKSHKDFDIKWHSTDAWRGYQEAVPKPNTNWFEVHADWTTGDWEDAGEHAVSKQKTKILQFRDKISQAGGTTKFLHLPTTNVFSSSLQVFARGVEESVAQDLARNIFG